MPKGDRKVWRETPSQGSFIGFPKALGTGSTTGPEDELWTIPGS